MAEMATEGAALAVIKRMFEDPDPEPLHGFPCKSTVSQFLEGSHYVSYSPEKWADPLLLFKWKLGAEEDIAEVMPATTVVVREKTLLSVLVKPELSVLGKRLKAKWESVSEYEDLEEIEYWTSSAEWPVARTMMNTTCISNLKDEAAVVRLFLLQIMLSEPSELTQASSLVQQIAVNMDVKEDKCTGSWIPPAENSICPPIATSTSKLYVLTIDEYVDDLFSERDLSSWSICIPVSASWSGMSWLMAYILSFTCTSWWNHAYTLDVEYSNAVEEATEGLSMKATFMPKAATVYIRGNYSNICLVVIDATRAQFPEDWQFEVCKGITASRDGNLEFAKKAYAYLGRLSDPDVTAMTPSDLTCALQNMTYMFSSTELKQLKLKASILAYSRFNGFGCYPNPEPPENRKNIFGPAAFNNKDEIQIGDYIVPDLAKMQKEERRCRQHDLNFWRCDPLGYFARSRVDFKQHTTSMDSADQYRLFSSSDIMRILRACGVFANTPESGNHWNQGILAKIDLDTSMKYASLMLGLTNWYLVETGCTLFQHNYGLNTYTLHDLHSIWAKITSEYDINYHSHYCKVGCFCKRINLAGKRMMNITEQEDSKEDNWIHRHYSGNVPWWFVGAIAAKFGHSFQIKSPSLSPFENEIGWLIDEESGPYDLSLLTASNQYEMKVRRGYEPYFPILTPTLRSPSHDISHNMISWDMNSLLDKKKSKHVQTKIVDFVGIVELNVVIFPKVSVLMDHKYGRYAFVASDNRISADRYTWPRVSFADYF